MESYHIIIDLQFHLFVDQSHKSHNAPALYPTKHQSEHKYAHFCSAWYIVGFVN